MYDPNYNNLEITTENIKLVCTISQIFYFQYFTYCIEMVTAIKFSSSEVSGSEVHREGKVTMRSTLGLSNE